MVRKITWKDCKKAIKNQPYHLSQKDDRYKKSKQLQKKIGFRYEETWNLNTTLAAYMLPRVLWLKNHTHSFPVSFNNINEWKDVLNHICWSLYQTLTSEAEYKITLNNEEEEKTGKPKSILLRQVYEEIREGYQKLGEYFPDLWD